jgi:hypothetical protein
MQNFHIINARYISQTNRFPGRVQLYSPRFKERIYFEYESNQGQTFEQAENFLQKIGYNVIGHAQSNDGFSIVTDTFKPLKECYEDYIVRSVTEEIEADKTPEKRGYNSGKLSIDLLQRVKPWITNPRATMYSIEPNTQNQVKRGYKYRLMIIDGLGELMDDNTAENLLHVYNYETEAQAEQDIEKLNSEKDKHNIYLTSF